MGVLASAETSNLFFVFLGLLGEREDVHDVTPSRDACRCRSCGQDGVIDVAETNVGDADVAEADALDAAGIKDLFGGHERRVL